MELKGRLCRLMCRLLRQISTAIFRSSPQNALSVWFKLDVFHGDYDTHVGVGVCVCVFIPFIPPLAAARCLLQVAFIGGLTRWLVILNLDSNQAKSLAAGADVYTKIHFI